MRFFEKTKGAVSIFLVLILVPMMTIASSFVDAGKVKLGRTMVESAGDLALNTALTNYDYDLKTLYGLMATAQDTSDLFMKLEDYFTESITSTGVSEEESIYFTGQIMDTLGLVAESNEIADIMNIQVADFAVEKLKNASLENPALLKRQIIDFMKYRAPINTGMSFISSLKSFSTLKKQTAVIEAKQDYYEKQQTLLEDLKAAWGHIAAYNTTKVAYVDGYVESANTNMEILRNGGKIGNDEYNGYFQIKNTDRPIGLHHLLIWDLYDSKDYLVYDYRINEAADFTYKTPSGEFDSDKAPIFDETMQGYKSIYYTGKGVQDKFDVYCEQYAKSFKKNPDGSTLPTVSDFTEQLTAFFNKAGTVETAEKELEGLTKKKDNEHLVRFFVNLMREKDKYANLPKYSSAMYSLYPTFQRLMAMKIWVQAYDYIEYDSEDEDEPPVEIEVITPEEILGTKIKLKGYGSKGEKTISAWIEEAEKIFGEKFGKFIAICEAFEEYEIKVNKEYNTSDNTVEGQLSMASTLAKEYQTQFTNAKNSLDMAIKMLNSAKTKLSGDLATAKEKWNTAATDSDISDTGLAKQDQAEIGQLDKYLNDANLTKLITRLTNVRDNVSATLAEIEKYQYCGVFYGDIATVGAMCEAFGDKNGAEFAAKLNTSADKSTMRSLAGTWQTKSCTVGKIDFEWVTKQSCQPNLNLDKPSLYSYLHSQFANTVPPTNPETPNVKQPVEGEGVGKDLYENIKSTSKSKSGEASEGLTEEPKEKEDGPSEIKGMENIPSKTFKATNTKDTPTGKFDADTDSGTTTAKDSLGGMFGGDFLTAVADFGEELRDNIYVSDYIMSMFSYDTIENEYRVEHNNKNPEPGDILSLRKQDISAANNHAYGKEIEYIVYGKEYAKNKALAYASIYGIRFGFNVVYAFATSEIRESAFAIATPISAATLGIIPVPLIQAVIIIGIACCESAIDLQALSAGNKVPLYKNQKTWRCSITGLLHTAKGMVTKKAKEMIKDVSEAVIDESLNKLNEILDETSDKIDGAISDYSEKANEAVSSTFNEVITQNAEVAIQQLTTYVNTAVQDTMFLDVGEEYESKKKEMLDWVKSKITEWGNQFTGSDMVSVVKREAVKVIVDNSDTCINLLFDAVESSVKSNSLVTDVKGVLEEYPQTASNEIDRLGGEIMDVIDSIRRKIGDWLGNTSAKVQAYKDEIFNDITESAAKGADELKATINEKIDGMFGTGENSIGGSDGSGMAGASFFSFAYSDYLRLFLIIGLFANEEKVILRTGDVIQVNMGLKEEGYLLSNSAVYVAVDAKILVKPTLLALPLFANVENNPIAHSDWYSLEYNGIAGY